MYSKSELFTYVEKHLIIARIQNSVMFVRTYSYSVNCSQCTQAKVKLTKIRVYDF